MKFLRFRFLIFLALGLSACNSISVNRIKPTEIPAFVTSIAIQINAPTLTPTTPSTFVPTATATATRTSTLVPTATATALQVNTPTRTLTPTPTQPPVTPTPTLPAIPPGMGALKVVNHYATELDYDIESKLYRIAPNSSLVIVVSPGNHSYSATMPGYASKTGVVEIQANYYRIQDWGLGNPGN